MASRESIAIVGGGATSVYLVYQLLQKAESGTEITVIDVSEHIGPGMPYGPAWTNPEHMANITCEEIPELVETPHHWLAKKSNSWLRAHGLERDRVTPSLLMPRLLLGLYLEEQLVLIQKLAAEKGIHLILRPNCRVTDIADQPTANNVCLSLQKKDAQPEKLVVSKLVIATGHAWPQRKEPDVKQYFDSPWPITKIEGRHNHPVGLLGSSLSAVDSLMTLAKNHGKFWRDGEGVLHYRPFVQTEKFKVIMHSRHGLLPSLRSYYEDAQFETHPFLSRAKIEAHIKSNGGFLSLDYIFDNLYKKTIKEKDPCFYAEIKGMNIESFVAYIYKKRQSMDAFSLFQHEFGQSEESVRRHKPIYWKDVLESLSYTTTFHAKHMSGEDMTRLKNVLMPLVSIIVASLPLESAEKMLALYDAGKLDIKAIGSHSTLETAPDQKGATLRYRDPQNDSEVSLHYPLFINCIGQERMSISAFPFPTLVKQGVVTEARLKCCFNAAVHKRNLPPLLENAKKSGRNYYINANAIAVDDQLRPLNCYNKPNQRITLLAVSFISGLYPDHSGLPFCDEVAKITAGNILKFAGVDSSNEQKKLFAPKSQKELNVGARYVGGLRKTA